MRISVPFFGIDAVSVACKKNALDHKSVNVLEVNPNLTNYLSALHGRPILPTDVLKIDYATLEASEVLVCGPPCQPWARGGAGLGWLDERSKCMLAADEIAGALKRKGCLRAVCIENTPAILESRKNGEAPMKVIQDKWAEEMPNWFPLQPWVLDGEAFCTPMMRTRAYLVSVPLAFKDIFNQSGDDGFFPMLAPPKRTGDPQWRLIDYLNYCAEGDGLTTDKIRGPKQKIYYEQWKETAYDALKQRPSNVAVVDGSRSPCGSFSTNLQFDRLPSCMTQNRNLFVFGDSTVVSKIPIGGRYLAVEERAKVMGFDCGGVLAKLTGNLTSPQLMIALGNTMLVNVVGAVLKQIWNYLAVVETGSPRLSLDDKPMTPMKRRPREKSRPPML